MPVVFIGHGNPMNALEINSHTSGWRRVGNELPKPSAILCISAHWETNGLFFHSAPQPRTIHDFYGFPEALERFVYSAPGSPEWAERCMAELEKHEAGLDLRWGLDHGAWSVLTHLVPDASVPVFQMSLNRSLPLPRHRQLAEDLRPLRRKGLLVLCSGNAVHNLRLFNWRAMENPAPDWALAFDLRLKEIISAGNYGQVAELAKDKLFQAAHPTAEHFLPALYSTALLEADEQVRFFSEGIVGGTVSMRSWVSV